MSLTPQQRQIAKKIVRIGRKRGATPTQIKAALETGLVESNLSNPSYGTGDSMGWRQERASLYKNPTNLNASINRFYDETSAIHGRYKHSGQIAAAVQRPAAQYRGRYQQRAGEAGAILSSLGGGSPGGYQTTTTRTTAGVDNSALRQQALQQYLTRTHDPDALLTLGLTLRNAQDVAPTTTVTRGQTGYGSSAGFGGKVKLAPTADRAGVHTNHRVTSFVKRISSIYGRPLTIGTGTNHSRMTVNGNVSDHWSGNAADIPARGRQLIRLGQDALIAAGMDPKKARKQTGGLFNVNGHQIIFNTHIGGDHTNHLHVSAK